MGVRMGSVTECKNCTMGLKGSGLTQLMSALMMIIQYRTENAISRTFAIAANKLDMINIPRATFNKHTTYGTK